MPMPPASRLAGCSREHALLLLLERPFEQGRRRGFVPPPSPRRLVLLPSHELGPREQRPLRLRVGGVRDALGGHCGPDRDRLRLRASPAFVGEQRLARDLPGLLDDGLDRAGVLLTGDDLPRQGEHEVVAVGGKAVLGQLAIDGQRRLELLRHEFERVGLKGVLGDATLCPGVPTPGLEPVPSTDALQYPCRRMGTGDAARIRAHLVDEAARARAAGESRLTVVVGDVVSVVRIVDSARTTAVIQVLETQLLCKAAGMEFLQQRGLGRAAVFTFRVLP